MGPSRVLVLGPDSSVSPLIFAAIGPSLVAGDDPATAIALAGMLALIVGAIEIGLGVGKLGFVADLLSKEVQVGYMNGLGDHDHRRPAAQAVRLLHRRRRLRRRAARVLRRTSTRRNATALSPRPGHAGRPARAAPRLTARCPAVLVAVVGRDRRVRRAGPRRHGVTTVGALPQGLPTPGAAVDPSSSDVGSAARRRGRHHAGVADRHHRDLDQLRGPPGRRGRPEPGDDRARARANVAAGLFQGFAVSTSGSRTAVAEQSGAKSQVTGLVGAGAVALMLLFLNSLLADLPQTALAAVVIAAALSLMNLAGAAPLLAGPPHRVRAVAGGHRRRRLLRRAGGHPGRRRPVDPAVLPAQLVAARRGARPRRRAGGWHSIDGRADPSSWPDIVVFRWEAPLFFANAGHVPPAGPPPRPRGAAPVGRAAVRGDDRHRRHRRRDAGAARHGAQRARASTWPSSSCATGCRTCVLRYGLFETLDREHFYPSVDAALAAIAADEEDGGVGSPRRLTWASVGAPGRIRTCATASGGRCSIP